MQAETPFKGEIYINKLKKEFSIYAVLRSGHGTKRHGVTKMARIDGLKLEPMQLVDKPISINGKTYRANSRKIKEDLLMSNPDAILFDTGSLLALFNRSE